MTKYILSSDEKGSNPKECATFKEVWEAHWHYELFYGQFFITFVDDEEAKQ